MQRKFNKLVDEWRSGTGGLSSPRVISNHPAYLEIINMGEDVLPLIFEDFKNNGGWWFPALRKLTNVNPIPEYAKGNTKLNAEIWLKWGYEHGYI